MMMSKQSGNDEAKNITNHFVSCRSDYRMRPETGQHASHVCRRGI